MAFISYAQNFEDAMLWRALRHIPNGRYIDIGAQHPTIDSVSKAFYENGWRGVHVEPVPEYADLLRNDRPDETVLQMAISDVTGILELNVIPGTGLSTGVAEYAERHHESLGLQHHVLKVPMLPMKTALASLSELEVHWLKIDVEGLEEEVLRGWDSRALRPWIILIEATVPLSTELSFTGADRLLLDANYQFAYFDGLNRFYVAAEHADLARSLQTPPNVFDNIELSGTSGPWCQGLIAAHRAERDSTFAKSAAIEEELTHALTAANTRLSHVQADLQRVCALSAETEARAIRAEARTTQAENRTTQAEARTTQAEAHATQVEARAAHAEERARATEHHFKQMEARSADAETRLAESEERRDALATHLQAVLNSSSWRVTAPVRSICAPFHGFSSYFRERIVPGVKRRVKALLRSAAHGVVTHPVLKRCAVIGLSCVPPVRRRLQRALAPPPVASAPTSDVQDIELPHELHLLSPDATCIYGQLKRQQQANGDTECGS
ncbi:FkbM family methyltransferase [Variovorax sp. J22R115]|uniref:FkbM family methyltransferase n=1 Tax=Variovorax sp. J22R115 TaxID=3053509 RepID=UPI0025761EE2|nr:FkbM family methyltransferase [Variovorax sp. J22R115]MDM0049023.1 FkbM family methyltransferase [Variovorax sp. J22R115]